MLDNQKLMAFITTKDAAISRHFYESVLGIKVKDADDFGINFVANGNYLRLSIVPDFKAAPYAVLSWVVTDIHKVITALKVKGIVFEHYHGLGQNEMGVWTAPDETKVAWFKDPDQNILSLTQFKVSDH